MSTDVNPYASPQAATEEQEAESLLAALVKCIVVGFGVGVLGVVVCIALLPLLLVIREKGLLLLLLAIPFATWYTVVATRNYLAQAPSRFRGAVAWSIRYLVVGAGLGLVLKLFVFGGAISDTPLFVFLGCLIGTMSGSMGGAFHGWREARRRLAATGEGG